MATFAHQDVVDAAALAHRAVGLEQIVAAVAPAVWRAHGEALRSLGRYLGGGADRPQPAARVASALHLGLEPIALPEPKRKDNPSHSNLAAQREPDADQAVTQHNAEQINRRQTHTEDRKDRTAPSGCAYRPRRALRLKRTRKSP